MFGLAFLITLIFMAIVIGVGSYARFVNPGLSRMKKDVLSLRTQLTPLTKNLIPVEREELDLLSFNIVGAGRSRKLFRRTRRGFIHTIYEEPLIAYAIKNYPTPSGKRIIYARTRNSEFVFIRGKSKTQLYIDGKPVGHLEGSRILGLGGGQTISKITEDKKLPGEVMIGSKKVAMLNPPSEVTGNHPRVFRYLGELSVDEKKILLAMVVYKMLSSNEK